MIRRYIFPAVVILLVVVCVTIGMFALLSSEAKQVDVPPELNASLLELRTTIDSRTAEVEMSLLSTAKSLSSIKAGDPNLDVILRAFYDQFPESVGVCYVDENIDAGRSVPLSSLYTLIREPMFQNLTASSFSEEAVLMFGPVYTPAYGEIIAFVAPVYSPEGIYRGYLCNAMDPSGMISEDLYPGARYYGDTDYLIWTVLADGTILYAPDNDFINTQLSDDLFYPELFPKGTVDFILSQPNGAVQYRPSTAEERIAAWTTTYVADKEVRLLLAMSGGYETVPILPLSPVDTEAMREAALSLSFYMLENGPEKTVAELKKSNGMFSGTDFSYFVYTMNGTVIYDTDYPGAVGKNRLNSRDAYGLRPISTSILRSMQGGGYVSFYEPLRLFDGDHAVVYLSYVAPVDDEWFVGVRMPIVNSPILIDSTKREMILQMTHNMTSYVLIHGKDAALAEFNRPDGRFFSKNISVSALAYDGTILADSLHPEMVGENAFFYTDASGSSSMREVVILAKLGGGYMYLGVEDTEQKSILLSLLFVEPMEGDWCICSGVALDLVRF